MYSMTIELDYRPELEPDLADRMRKSLRVSDVPVQAMADYLEVNRVTVGRWINGHTQPSAGVLRAWALRTGVPYAWLRDGWAPWGSNPQPVGCVVAQVSGSSPLAALERAA
jgi:transcriptional regulator with XRE-family HTH domain